MKRIYKDPDSKKLISVDFTRWLGDSNIASVEWTTETNNLTVSDTSFNAKVANAYVSGGSLDQEYYVKCAITTDDSVARIEARTFQILVTRTC